MALTEIGFVLILYIVLIINYADCWPWFPFILKNFWREEYCMGIFLFSFLFLTCPFGIGKESCRF